MFNIGNTQRTSAPVFNNILDFLKSSTWAGRTIQLISGVACLSLGYCLVHFVAQKYFKRAELESAPITKPSPLAGGALFEVEASKLFQIQLLRQPSEDRLSPSLTDLQTDLIQKKAPLRALILSLQTLRGGHCPEQPLKDGSSPLLSVSELLQAVLFQIYTKMDAETFYSFSTTCRSLHGHLANPNFIKLTIEKIVPQWIDDCTNITVWSSSFTLRLSIATATQKERISRIFKVLFLFPHEVMFPDLGAPTIPLMQKMFRYFDEKTGGHTSCLKDKLDSILSKTYAKKSYLDLNPQKEKFLYNMPHVTLVALRDVPCMRELSYRYDQRLLTERDGRAFCRTRDEDAAYFFNNFIFGASLNFIGRCLRDNHVFVENCREALLLLSEKNEQDFRQKITIFLDFYEDQIQSGFNSRYVEEHHKQRALQAILSVIASFICPRHPLLIRKNIKIWAARLRDFASHGYEENPQWKKPLSLERGVARFEAFASLWQNLQDEINQLPAPAPFEDQNLCQFSVKFDEEFYVFQSLEELSKHSNLFALLQNFKTEDQIDLPTSEEICNKQMQAALKYLQGKEISLEEDSCFNLLQASLFLQIPRLSLVCQRMLIEMLVDRGLETNTDDLTELSYLCQAMQLYSAGPITIIDAKDSGMTFSEVKAVIETIADKELKYNKVYNRTSDFITNEYFDRDFRGRYFNPNPPETILLAKVANDIVGFIITVKSKMLVMGDDGFFTERDLSCDTGCIARLAVDSKTTRLGVGTKLMLAAMCKTKELGKCYLDLDYRSKGARVDKQREQAQKRFFNSFTIKFRIPVEKELSMKSRESWVHACYDLKDIDFSVMK